jgi:hypothetical protein
MLLTALMLLGGAGLTLLSQPRVQSELGIASAPHAPQPLPHDFAVGDAQETALFSQLDAGDRQWLPQAVPLPGGGTRYTYKHISGEPPLTLDQIKALIRRPPTYTTERLAIRDLLRQLRRAGVGVVLGQPRKQGAAGEWEPRRMVVRIRPDVPGKGSREFVRVLNHESIHVAQSCRNGSIRAQPVPLGLPRSLDARQLRSLAAPIYANATVRERALEEEAYANQHNLSLGLQLLQVHCKR